MRHLIVVCLAFMIGFNMACSRVEDLGKDDLHSEPTLLVVDSDLVNIKGFSLAHELATNEGLLPNGIGEEFGYTDAYIYKVYVARTEYVYADSLYFLASDTTGHTTGFYPYRANDENYSVENIQFDLRCPYRWGWVGGEDRGEIWDTALLHLIRSAKGEDMDVWIPCQPSELSYRCVILRDGNRSE